MRKIFGAMFWALLPVSFLASQDSVRKELPRGWWYIPRTDARFTFGGYVKFDFIHDFNPINSISFFDVGKIPTDGSKGTNTHLQANETRLFFDFRQPIGKTDLRAYVEGDFYGSGGAFRFRHAFVEIGGKLMAGQFWSNFMDELLLPPTLDFEKPTAYAFVRHGLIRYTFHTSKKGILAIALEEPLVDVQAPAQPGRVESFIPDLTAKYRHAGAWGHAQVSAFAGAVRFRPESGDLRTTMTYSANLSGQLKFGKKDYVAGQLIFGPGIARYRAGKYAAPDAQGQLKAIPGYGITGMLQHYWTDRLSSFFVVNYGEEDNTVAQPDSDIHAAYYGAINLIWHFHKSAFAGVEYLHGSREDISGASGNANRIMFSIQVNINKH